MTGNLLAVFGLTGDLALDETRDLLYVDKYPYGLTVIDTVTNEPLNDIQLPSGERNNARPQADPATGNGLQALDMATMAVVQTVPAPIDGQLVGFNPVTDSLGMVFI